MTDSELRGIMLHRFYDLRRQGYVQIPTDDVFDQDTAFDICRQLAEHGLINWKPLEALGGFRTGMGLITASGVDVVEGTKDSPISIVLDSSVSVSGSSNVQIGNANIQGVNAHDLRLAVDRASMTEVEKQEAKSILQRFLENSLIAKIFGNS
jgi:hypothetical protein